MKSKLTNAELAVLSLVNEALTIAKVRYEFMPDSIKPNGYHHEIYLNDHRRVALKN